MRNSALNARTKKKNPSRLMRNLKFLGLLVLVSSFVIAVDQFLKIMVLRLLVYGDSIPVIEGFFSLTLVFNTGAAFGILQGKKDLFLILPVLTIIFILILYIRAKEKQKIAIPLGLLLGGTIGNFIDRLRFGYVVDFFDLFFRSWHWPAFNIADSCICLGVFLLLFRLMEKKNAPGAD